jgi:hypothetical protein
VGLKREAQILETNPGLGTYLVWGRGLPRSGEISGLWEGAPQFWGGVRVVRVIRVIRVC